MTSLSRWFLEPGAWSAAVKKNFSVLVGAGRIFGTEALLSSWSGGMYEFEGWAVYELDETRGGAIEGGGVKNDRSSKVSKKWL